MSEVQGFNKWERQIKRMPQGAFQALRVSQDKNAAQLARTIHALAPVGKNGWLAKSVNWRRGPPPATAATGRWSLRNKALTERQVTLMDYDLLVTVYAGDNRAFYARFVNDGTRASVHGDTYKDRRGRLRKVKRNHPGTKPQPFFSAPVRAFRDKYQRSTAAAANRGIKKAVQG